MDNRSLPSGYIQLNYIRSTGTQYIDAGFKPNNNTRVVMDFQFASAPTSDHAVIFGARDSANVKSFCVFYITSGYFRSDYNTTNTNQWAINSTTRYTIDKNKETTSLNNTSQSYPAATFQCDYNMYLFALNTGGSLGFRSVGLILYSCQIYDNGTLIRDFVPALNQSGVAGLYDVVNGKFYSNAGSGKFFYVKSSSTSNDTDLNHKKLYISINGTYCKVKNELLTADGVYNKVKKAFITIGGVYRPCWSGGELTYYGPAIPLSQGRSLLAATTVGGYALFGGGFATDPEYGETTTVDAYDASLTRTTPTALSIARGRLAATTVGSYAIFGGGYKGDLLSSVNAYDVSLTRTIPTALSTARRDLAATTVGGYALFGGGFAKNFVLTAAVDAYDTSLTKTIPTVISVARAELAAATIGEYALFCGGTSSNVVDAYDTSLTRITLAALSVARGALAATTIGSYALFGGGGTSYNNRHAAVDAYDASLTRTIPDTLSLKKSYLAATTVGEYAIFGGGSTYNDGDAVRVSTVDAYDASLTRTTPTALSIARERLAATTVGNYAIFGGGDSGQYAQSNVVDVYTIS